MVDSTSNTVLPYTYAPLSPGNEPQGIAQAARQTKRPLKAGLAILSGLMALALMITLMDYSENKAVVGNEFESSADDLRLRPPPENVASVEVTPGSNEILFKVTRGKPHGVSEKANDLPMRGIPTPYFDWNDLQLSWQRTAFHFQPHKNWMNDPNGPLYYKGWYHFFYQYNPGGAVWGNIVWGHAVSKDLVRWTHLPLAMVADEWYDFNGVWTGSATLLPDGQIVMLYTGSTNQSVQVQNLAYPADLSDPLLREWVKYPGNPVLVPPPGIDIKDFRDPTTAWLTSEGKWRITIGSKINKTGISLVYETTDFKKYELLPNILHQVSGTGMWECVDFYPVSKFEPNGLDTSVKGPHVKHVLKASMDDDRQDYYALGTYNEANASWIPDEPSLDVGIGLRYDYGGLFYAAKTFYDQEKKRRILWGWMPEGDSEAADVKKGWSAVQAIPRTVLYDQDTGAFLLQWPVEEVETLRNHQKDFKDVEISPGSIVHLNVHDASEMDIEAEFSIDQQALEKLPVSNELYTCPAGGAARKGALGPFGFSVLADKDLSEQTTVYFYVVKTADPRFPLRTYFCTDLSRSSDAPDVRKGIYGTTVPHLKDEKLSLRILVDHSIVEAYAQGGRKCITTRVYPTRAIYKDAKLFLFNNATEATVTASVKTWQMSSARTLFYSVWAHLTIMLAVFFIIV